MNKKRRLIVMAGGTGGHIFPGLTVAHYLIAQGWYVHWLGVADRIEAYLVPKYGIEIDFIRISGLRGKGMKALLISPIQVFNSWRQARNIIRAWKPDVVLGMGGYVSGPGVLAAWSYGVPIIVHEQNSIAGLTNILLAKLATKVMQAFPGALSNAEVVGNPIRTDILKLDSPQQRLAGREGPIRILVIGGSQGACVLNYILPQVAAIMGDSITIWHQTGRNNQYQVTIDYKKIRQVQYKINEFIDNIAAAYAWADVVVCRAGALTVSEIAAVGLPAIFVPFQHKDRQQYWNALLLEKAGAAYILEQSKFTAIAVAEILKQWNRPILLRMAQYARNVAILDATERIAKVISNIAN